MVRVQSYFPRRLLEELKIIAEKNDVSLAEVIRVSAADFIENVSKSKSYKDGASILLKSYSRLKFKGPKDLSKILDKYIYG